MHILRTADGYLVGGYRMDTTFPVVAFTCAYSGGSSFSPSGHPTLISIINSAQSTSSLCTAPHPGTQQSKSASLQFHSALVLKQWSHVSNPSLI